MKQVAKFLAAIALIAAVCVGFASCDDDNNGGEPKPSSTPTLSNTFKLAASDDFLELADITVDYTDFAGAKHTKVITVDDSLITFTTKTYPASSTFAVTVTPKNVEPTKDKYDIKFNIELGSKIIKSNGESTLVGSFGRFSRNSRGVVKARVATTIARYKEEIESKNADYSHQYFNNNGVITFK